MRENLEERCVDLANYVIENKATVRDTAKVWHISKSTVHNDLTYRLKTTNKNLYLQVKEVLDFNKSQRHIRGGLSTKLKFTHKPPTV